MEGKRDYRDFSDDFDEDGELDVEHYPIPKGLEEAWEELTKKVNEKE